MTSKELHEIMSEIDHVTDLSDLHLHIFKINDVMGDVSFSGLAGEEEDRLKEWLEKFHNVMATIAEDVNISSYDITISGGSSPISFNALVKQVVDSDTNVRPVAVASPIQPLTTVD